MATSTDALMPRTVTHPRLSTETTWTALGDLSLLDATSFVPVILSRSLMPAKLDAEIKRITDAVRAGAKTIDGVKRRTEATSGRCQGAFCAERIMEIIAKELDIPVSDVLKDGIGSKILEGLL